MQPNQTRKQMPDTLLCLLPDCTTVQRAHKAVKKAQGMTGINQVHPTSLLLVGPKDLKPILTWPYIKLKYIQPPTILL